MRRCALAVLIGSLALSTLHAAPPAVPIEQALKLAQDYLAGRGLAREHYIGSLELQDSSLLGGSRYWVARWVPAIRADGKTESALRINLDGSIVRLVNEGPKAGRRPKLGSH